MMKTVTLVLALFFNVVFLVVAALATASEGVALGGRICAALVVLGLAGVVALLVLARLERVPPWGTLTMRVLAVAVPVLWLLGSLEGEGASTPELVFLAIVALVSWGSWRVFRSQRQPAAQAPG